MLIFNAKSLDFMGFYILGGLKKCMAANSKTFYKTNVSMSRGISSSIEESSNIFAINLLIFLNLMSIVNFCKSFVINVSSYTFSTILWLKFQKVNFFKFLKFIKYLYNWLYFL